MYLPQRNVATLDYFHDIELVYQYSSKTEVLDVISSVHKKLSSTVKYILLNALSEIKNSSSDSDVIQPALILDNINAK